MHTDCGYPVKSTWLKAVPARNYVGWPLLSIENVYKHYSKTEEKPKGYLNQSGQNVWSTKPKATPFPETNSTTIQGKTARYLYFKVYEAKHKTYSYQTGRFPFHSKRGYKYIMFVVKIYSNTTLVTPMKNRMDSEMQRGYLIFLNRIKQTVIALSCHILYNKCS